MPAAPQLPTFCLIHSQTSASFWTPNTTLRDVTLNLQQPTLSAPEARSNSHAHLWTQEDAERAVQYALDKFGCLDILVNCAAGNFLALPEGAQTLAQFAQPVLGVFPSRNASRPLVAHALRRRAWTTCSEAEALACT